MSRPLESPRAEPRPGGAPRRSDQVELLELLDLAFDAIFVRGFRDRLITYWNQGAAGLYGWTSDEALGRVPGDLLRTRYPIPLEEIEWELLATGRWEGELVQQNRAGEQLVVAGRWVLRRDHDGEPAAILEINSDVTRRSLAERSLRGSEERFRLLVAAVRDYAIFMLDPRGYVTSWNEGARRIKGYESDEIIGRHFSVFYPREDVIAGKPQRVLDRVRREGSFEEEAWRVRKDGSAFWADVAMTPLYDDAGVLQGYAKVTRDLTARRAQEESLREHADRLAELEMAKSNFLNLASHELRGPLTVLRGYLAMLEDGTLGELSEGGQKVMPVLSGKVDEMSTLVEQMLEVARLEEGRTAVELHTADLRDLVEEAVDRARRTAALTPSHEIDLRLPPEPVYVDVDRSRCATIVGNLLSNAVKYSPEGGRIRCAVQATAGKGCVTVEDEGLGIEPEHQERLFTRFGRIVTPLTSGIPGTGLGLYLSRELALLQGGDIDFTSTPGRGSVFTLRLPLSPA